MCIVLCNPSRMVSRPFNPPKRCKFPLSSWHHDDVQIRIVAPFNLSLFAEPKRNISIVSLQTVIPPMRLQSHFPNSELLETITDSCSSQLSPRTDNQMSNVAPALWPFEVYAFLSSSATLMGSQCSTTNLGLRVLLHAIVEIYLLHKVGDQNNTENEYHCLIQDGCVGWFNNDKCDNRTCSMPRCSHHNNLWKSKELRGISVLQSKPTEQICLGPGMHSPQ